MSLNFYETYTEDLEDGEISPEEAAFMQGYNESEDLQWKTT